MEINKDDLELRVDFVYAVEEYIEGREHRIHPNSLAIGEKYTLRILAKGAVRHIQL